MGKTMQRRQFLSRLTTLSDNPVLTDASSPTAEESFQETIHPPSVTRIAGTQSGLAPYAGAWTEKEVIHLLRRVMFGAAKKDVDAVKGMTVSAAVDFLIDNPVQPATTPVNNYTIVAGVGATDTGGVAFGSSWMDANLPDPADPVPVTPTAPAVKGPLNSNRINASFKPWWIGLMINQPPHILEKMTLFWANHFATDTINNSRAKVVFNHYKLLRTYGLTNFRTLLKQVTIDPHMLYFLGGNNSTKPTPNENYARELQELFTVGKGPDSHYTEDDVKAAAKVLSGWQVVDKSTVDGTYTSVFTASRHDTSTKTFSGFYNNKSIAPNGINEVDDLLNMILQTNECAKYLVRRLYRWFVYSTITTDVETNVIAPLADIFRTSNYDIPTVLKALFKSEHFFDTALYGGIIKSPVDLYVNMIREFNLTLAAAPVNVMYAHWKSFNDRCAVELQNIGDPPNVSGWPAYWNEEGKFYELWMSNSSTQVKAKNLYAYVKTGVKLNGITLQIDGTAFNKQFGADGLNPNLVVSNFVRYLLPMDLTPEQVVYLKTKLVPGGEQDVYWSNRWNTFTSTPSNMNNTTEVQGMLRDLINEITSLAEYFLY